MCLSIPTYFLAKTDPQTYSIEAFQKEKETVWDGVHNYQAINTIKQMRVDDLVLIYHSQGEAAIVGLAEVSGNPYKDEADPRGISLAWKLTYLATFPHAQRVTLKDIKNSGLFTHFALVRQPRLSTHGLHAGIDRMA